MVQHDIRPDAFLFLAGSLGASPAPWETLCPDVRGVIFSKLSLHELACAAQSSREFRQAYLCRRAEERDTLLSTGEQTFGKEAFSGFVRAIRQILAGLEPHPGVRPGYCLMVNAAGKLEPLARHPDLWEKSAGWRGCIRHLPPTTFVTELYVLHPGGMPAADMVGVRFQMCEEQVGMAAIASKEVIPASLGLLLAIVMEDPDGLQSRQRPPVDLHVHGRASLVPLALLGRKGLTGPLRSLVNVCVIDTP
jgi:hypothetical protein